MKPIDEEPQMNSELNEANRNVQIQPDDPLELPLNQNEIELNRDLEEEEPERPIQPVAVPGPEDVVEDEESI